MNIQLIDQQITDIQNGRRNLLQFNQPKHAGVCSAGPLLIGALIVCDLAGESLGTGNDAGQSETAIPN